MLSDEATSLGRKKMLIDGYQNKPGGSGLGGAEQTIIECNHGGRRRG